MLLLLIMLTWHCQSIFSSVFVKRKEKKSNCFFFSKIHPRTREEDQGESFPWWWLTLVKKNQQLIFTATSFQLYSKPINNITKTKNKNYNRLTMSCQHKGIEVWYIALLIWKFYQDYLYNFIFKELNRISSKSTRFRSKWKKISSN